MPNNDAAYFYRDAINRPVSKETLSHCILTLQERYSQTKITIGDVFTDIIKQITPNIHERDCDRLYASNLLINFLSEHKSHLSEFNFDNVAQVSTITGEQMLCYLWSFVLSGKPDQIEQKKRDFFGAIQQVIYGAFQSRVNSINRPYPKDYYGLFFFNLITDLVQYDPNLFVTDSIRYVYSRVYQHLSDKVIDSAFEQLSIDQQCRIALTWHGADKQQLSDWENIESQITECTISLESIEKKTSVYLDTDLPPDGSEPAFYYPFNLLPWVLTYGTSPVSRTKVKQKNIKDFDNFLRISHPTPAESFKRDLFKRLASQWLSTEFIQRHFKMSPLEFEVNFPQKIQLHLNLLSTCQKASRYCLPRRQQVVDDLIDIIKQQILSSQFAINADLQQLSAQVEVLNQLGEKIDADIDECMESVDLTLSSKQQLNSEEKSYLLQVIERSYNDLLPVMPLTNATDKLNYITTIDRHTIRVIEMIHDLHRVNLSMHVLETMRTDEIDCKHRNDKLNQISCSSKMFNLCFDDSNHPIRVSKRELDEIAAIDNTIMLLKQFDLPMAVGALQQLYQHVGDNAFNVEVLLHVSFQQALTKVFSKLEDLAGIMLLKKNDWMPSILHDHINRAHMEFQALFSQPQLDNLTERCHAITRTLSPLILHSTLWHALIQRWSFYPEAIKDRSRSVFFRSFIDRIGLFYKHKEYILPCLKTLRPLFMMAHDIDRYLLEKAESHKKPQGCSVQLWFSKPDYSLSHDQRIYQFVNKAYLSHIDLLKNHRAEDILPAWTFLQAQIEVLGNSPRFEFKKNTQPFEYRVNRHSM